MIMYMMHTTAIFHTLRHHPHHSYRTHKKMGALLQFSNKMAITLALGPGRSPASGGRWRTGLAVGYCACAEHIYKQKEKRERQRDREISNTKFPHGGLDALDTLHALGFLKFENIVLSNKTFEFTARAARRPLCARIRCLSSLGAASCDPNRSEPPIALKFAARAPSQPLMVLENAARATSELPVHSKTLLELWVTLCSGSRRAVVLCTLQCTGSHCFQKWCSKRNHCSKSQVYVSKVLLEITARNHCSKSQVYVSLSSVTLQSALPCNVHGYARAHTSMYVYIHTYVYIYIFISHIRRPRVGHQAVEATFQILQPATLADLATLQPVTFLRL